ncbi:MAG: phage virion morphogenesis protein [Desulfovibrionaceae bacterium]
MTAQTIPAPAGVTLSVKVDDSQFKEALNRLQRRARYLQPAFADIAGRLLLSAQHRFENQQGPDGQAWPALLASTLAARAKAGKSGPILRIQGNLLRSYTQRSDNSGAEVGSNWLYARIHELGGTTRAHTIRPVKKKALAFGNAVVRSVNHPGSKIPARSVLGVDNKDGKAILHTIQHYLEQAL